MQSNIIIRNYDPSTDYNEIYRLYTANNSFGGQYDDARDAKEKIDTLSKANPNKILVATNENKIVGTVTIFEDGRSAWLYRFAVDKTDEHTIAKKLFEEAKKHLKAWGHTQILVYAPTNEASFEERYTQIGFQKGNNFTAFRQNI